MSQKFKYQRTLHLKFSPGSTSDDKFAENYDDLLGRRVIVTLKMDGENTSCYRDAIHARSMDSQHHPSRDWVKAFWGSIKHNIPEGWRVCGENLYAKHSLFYEDLPTYFLGFSLWDENNYCLCWDDTLTLYKDIGIIPVRTIYDGVFDEEKLKDLAESPIVKSNEGFVVRSADGFYYQDFQKRVFKYVRKNHVRTSTHWMSSEIVPNKLK
jgi:hypothetical protein